MPQKIDIHGLFIDPETITDLLLQKRISVFYPVFYEVEAKKTFFGRGGSSQEHILRFDHLEPYGIILADAEQPDAGSFIVKYQQAVFERIFRGLGQAGKNITGHINEMLKIEISGDRKYRILQSGRNVKETTIREIPAKVRLLSNQWVDVFKSSPGYDFQGGTPYAVTDVGSSALMIVTKDSNYVLFGAGVDASNEDVSTAYQSLTEIYNRIQAARDEKAKIPEIQKPQIGFQLPKIGLPNIKFQSPFVIGKNEDKEPVEVSEQNDSET